MKLQSLFLGVASWFIISEIYTNYRKTEMETYVKSLSGTKLDVGATGTGNIFSKTTIIEDATKCDIITKEGITYCDLSKSLPYSDNEFDIIFVTHVLEHINPNEVINAINELNRVGKRVIILLPHPLTILFYAVPQHKSLIYKTDKGICVRNNPLFASYFNQDIDLNKLKFEVYT